MIAVRPLLFTRSGSVSYGFSGHWLRSFHLWSVDALMFRAFGEQGLAQIHTPQRVVMRGAPKHRNWHRGQTFKTLHVPLGYQFTASQQSLTRIR